MKNRPFREPTPLASRPRARAARGFTLLELMLTVTVAGILVAVGLPSYRYITNSNRIAGEVNGLLGDIQFARGEAIKDGLPVTICTSANGISCAASTAWATGWIVFNDPNANQAVDAGEVVRRYQQALKPGDTLSANNNISAITFNREGFALGLPGTVTITLHEPTSNAQWTRCLQVTIVGQLSVIRAGTGACT